MMNSMKYIRLLATITLVVVIISCVKEPEIVYYQFTNDDFAIMPEYEKEQEITFKNQNGDETVFIISSAQLTKEQKTYFGFFGISYLYFYDRYEIYIETHIDGERFVNSLRFRREPTDIETAKWDYTVLYPNEFYGVIGFPLQNRAEGFNIMSEYSEIIDMVFDNNVSFSNVRVFKTNNSSPWIPGDGLERRVHTFYYADNIGFIGYDELDGNEWRRK